MRAPSEMESVIVKDVVEEADEIFTITFEPDNNLGWNEMVPGNFLMVWVPGVDEVPMSISLRKEEPLVLGFTVQNIGEATQALCSLKKGDRIAIRGPYGNGFSLPLKKEVKTIIGVSGGVGGASTILPMEWAFENGFRTVNIVGSRSKKNFLFEERWKGCSKELILTTDDGTLGKKGFVTERLRELLGSMKKTDMKKSLIFSCGPEVMLIAVKEVLDEFEVKGQFSLERFMKCGIGLCDSCSVSGKRVCMDGPIFTLDMLDKMDEFGKVHRDRAGRPVPLMECVR